MKMFKTLLACCASAALLSSCGGGASGDGKNAKSGAEAIAAPAGTRWIETAAITPDNGVRMGNPNAPVKLVEYGALTCSHCATFSAESSDGLKGLIEKGTVSYEFRNFMLSPLDVPAATLARCGGPGPYFPLTEQLFAAQAEWLGKTKELTPADQEAAGKMQPLQQSAFLAEKLGLIEFVQQRGISAEKAKTCLANAKEVDDLVKMTDRGIKEFKVEGTPTFVINGITAKNTGTWEALRPKLIDAGA
jgi:protein-disulfide isomerase